MLKNKKYPSYLWAFVFLMTVWYIAAACTKLPFIPTPFVVMVNIFNIFYKSMLIHAFYSLWRISAGIAVSMAIGVPLGLCMGYYKSWDKLLSPIVYFVYPIPKIALIPIIMLLFGLDEASKIIMLALIIVFQIMVAARDAVKSIPAETYYSLYSLGAGYMDIFRKVIIPASLPGLLTALRVSLGTALSVLFFTETFGTEYGMGYFIMDAWTRVNYVDMLSGILVLSILGFLLFLVIDALEKLLCRWKV